MAGRLKVAIQGELGAFSHQAALVALGAESEILPLETFDLLFAAVERGEADRALLPIENSLAGSIHENYDRLSASSLSIVGEAQSRIEQCLIGLPGTRIDDIVRVRSHPVALAQCRTFFARRPSVAAEAVYDTAGAVRTLLRQGTASDAAIASRLAAEIYGGVVLLDGIEDDPQNFTRFLVLAREGVAGARATKTSVVFTLRNIPGALYQALGAFAGRGVDLAKIESRPLRGRPWEYAFYLDVLGDPSGVAGEAMAELRGLTGEFRVLGSYPDGLRRT